MKDKKTGSAPKPADPETVPVPRNKTIKEALEEKRNQAGTAVEQETSLETGVSRKRTKRIIMVGFALVMLGMLLAAGFLLVRTASPLAPGKVIMTIDDYAISSEEYLSYVLPLKKAYEDGKTENVWASNPQAAAEIKRAAEDDIIGQYTLLEFAAEYGYTVNDVTQEEFEKQKNSMIESLGGEEAYALALRQYCTTDEVCDMQIKQDMVIDRFTMALYTAGDDLVTVTDAQVKDYYDENDLYTVQQILFAVSVEDIELADKMYDSAEKVLDEIKAGTNFRSLMELYSSDTELAQYPDGYICAPGAQDPAFEAAALSLDFGEVYDAVVTVSYGYHIIMRIEPSYALMHAQLDDLITNTRIDAKRDEIQAKQAITYCSGYDQIDIATVKNPYQ